MARVAPRVPDLTDILCEKCGYVLNGLPTNGRCPECGTPVGESLGLHRLAPAWEITDGSLKGFVETTVSVVFEPTRFYKTFNVFGPPRAARAFAVRHWVLAGGLFAVAATTHAVWYSFEIMSWPPLIPNLRRWEVSCFLPVIVFVASYLALDLTTRLAGRLTNIEATYRGLRLTYPTVVRGLQYHAAHYFPVAVSAVVTTVGYQVLLRTGLLPVSSAVDYLYVLCGQVVVSAIYLFQTYWIGMRNMMYANR